MPYTPSPVSIDMLGDTALLEQLNERFATHVLPFDEAKEADFLVKTIGPLLSQVKSEASLSAQFSAETVRGYEDLYIRCQFLALDWLSEVEIIDLFRRHFSYALAMSENFDLWSKLRVLLVLRYILDERDAFKAKLRRALEENDELATGRPLTRNSQTISATIGHWLSDYASHVVGGSATSIAQAEYLASSPNMRQITAEEKSRLKWLFNLYERLKRSSMTSEGLEEVFVTDVDGQLMILKDGEAQEVDPKVTHLLEQFKRAGLVPETAPPVAVTTPATLSTKPFPETPSPFDEPSIKQRLAEWRSVSATKGEFVGRLYRGIHSQDRAAMLAALLLLAETGELRDLLRDERFARALSQVYQENQRIADLQALKLVPTEPRHLKAFVQALLTRQLKMPTHESARAAIDLVNALNRTASDKLTAWAYFDAASNQYQWL